MLAFKKNRKRVAQTLNKMTFVYGSFSESVPSSSNFVPDASFQAASKTFRPEELETETELPTRFSLPI